MILLFLFCFTLKGSRDCNWVFCSGSLSITLILCEWKERKCYQDRRESVIQGRVFPSTTQQFHRHLYILCSYAAFKCGAISRYQKDFLKAPKGAQRITACSHQLLKYPEECMNEPKTNTQWWRDWNTIHHDIIYSSFDLFIYLKKKEKHFPQSLCLLCTDTPICFPLKPREHLLMTMAKTSLCGQALSLWLLKLHLRNSIRFQLCVCEAICVLATY